MWKRKQSERERLQRELATAEAVAEHAEHELASIEQRAPVVQTIAGYLRDRRTENHFGDDFEIALTRRRKPT